MEITEIRIKLMESSEDRLRAFCSITIDGCFVIRDLKIIDGTNGPFVAMPSRKLTGHCNRCHHKNHLRAGFCNHCGNKLSFDSDGSLDSPQKLYADVAHPINSECREMIQDAVIEEFEAELSRCQQPGYRSRYDDDFSDAGENIDAALIDRPHPSPAPPKRRPTGVTQPEPAGNSDDEFGSGIF
ncbi:SpoVG family protein [Stieleria sp. TO1_6]|uniref:SpoVG family protein n=1 Tax=Stieleria tagensis TaxID=2956795 RepID=UPI00209B8D16|nr:SpoVG family protein [Stieleria tagensis]MCO8121786.1 SpoVG family protein [Stieleria tagensis]